MDKRRSKLLLDVASQFETASTPMNHTWLAENDVSLDECGNICDQLAGIIKGFAQAPQELRTLILVCSAADDPGQAKMMIAKLTESMALQTVIERLKKM